MNVVWKPLKPNPRCQQSRIKVKQMSVKSFCLSDENLFQRYKRTQCLRVTSEAQKRSERRLSKSEAESPREFQRSERRMLHWSERRPSKCEASNMYIAWSKLRCLRSNLGRSMIFKYICGSPTHIFLFMGEALKAVRKPISNESRETIKGECIG